MMAARAALASCAQPALVSGLAGLRLLETAIPYSLGHGEWTPREPICLVVHSGKARVRRPGIECHRTHQTLEPWCEVDGIPIAHPARSWLYTAATADVNALVLLGDALLRRQGPLIRPEELGAVFSNPGCVPGIKKARHALALIRPGTESTGESWTRLQIIRAGLPCPEVSIVVPRPDTGSFSIIDLGYEELMIGVECDGPHHTDPGQMERDVDRENALKALGWRIIRATASTYRDPTSFIEALRIARSEAIALRHARAA